MSRATKDYNSVDWTKIFYYDQSSKSGLRWVNDGMRHKAGDEAGNINPGCYATVSYNGSNYFAHRVIWIINNGELDNRFVIDHVDGDTLNNSLSNLRVTVQKFNNRNTSIRKDNNTGICGVHFTTAKSKSAKRLYTYCTATWYEEVNGKLKRLCRHFSENSLGIMVAFRDACEFRENKIAHLNSIGYNYADRHGKYQQ